MSRQQLGRETILAAIKVELEPLPYVLAMWEAGAAAFERVDKWSDIDLMIDVEDDDVQNVADRVEGILASLSRIDLKYEIPQPAWHGHLQVFYRLEEAGPFLLIDMCVMKHSNPNKFVEPEIHGNARVLFDKAGVVSSHPLDLKELETKLRDRVATLKTTVDLFQTLTVKELERGNNIEALAFYHGYSLRPLIELLRIHHAPTRYNFGTRYVYYDLPGEVVRRLEHLYFAQNAEDLRAKHDQTRRWFEELLGESMRAFPAC